MLAAPLPGKAVGYLAPIAIAAGYWKANGDMGKAMFSKAGILPEFSGNNP